jgi:hypothetical protein
MKCFRQQIGPRIHLISIVLLPQPVYKTVSISRYPLVVKLKLKDSVQTWLTSSINDPIVKIIAVNSHLTKTQLETLLIDILADNIARKSLNYDEKAHLRLTKARISRGSFNRTLKQARENVTKSIYTVILLGYIGVFESTTLTPYLEIANKLHTYLEAYKNILNEEDDATEQAKIIALLRKELETSLKQLSSTSDSSM